MFPAPCALPLKYYGVSIQNKYTTQTTENLSEVSWLRTNNSQPDGLERRTYCVYHPLLGNENQACMRTYAIKHSKADTHKKHSILANNKIRAARGKHNNKHERLQKQIQADQCTVLL